MTQPGTIRDAPHNLSPPRRWRGWLAVSVLGGLVLTAVLVLLTAAPQFSGAVSAALALAACLGFYTVVGPLTPPWKPDGYRNVGALIPWLTLGLPHAVAVIVVGQLISVPIQRRWAARFQLPPASLREQAQGGLAAGAVSLATAATAAAVYRALDGQHPLRTISPADWLPLLAALLSAFAVAEAVHALLWRRLLPPGAPELKGSDGLRPMLARVLPLPLAVILPLIYHAIDAAVFILSLALVMAHAVRYRQAEYQAALSADLADNLARLNESSYNVMLDFDRQRALATACRMALDIARADKAAIYLRQPETGELAVAEAVGLDSAYRARFRPPDGVADDQMRLAADVRQAGTAGALAELAQIGTFRALAELPLQSSARMLGYLGVYHDRPHDHTQNEIYLLRSLVNQLAAALDNADLLRDLELYAFETAHLVHLSTVAAASLEPECIAGEVSAIIRQMMGVDWAAVLMLDDHEPRVRMLSVAPPAPAAQAEPLPFITELQSLQQMRTYQRGQPGLSDGLNVLFARYRLETIVLVPLAIQREVFGAALVGCSTPCRLNDREERLLRAAVSQFSSQVCNARLYMQTVRTLDRRTEQQALIENLLQHISSAHDLPATIHMMLDGAARLTGADMAALALLTEFGDFWIVSHQYERDAEEAEPRRAYARLGRANGVLGRVVQTGVPVIVPDNAHDPDYIPIAPMAYRSALAVPLIREGQAIGALNLESVRPAFFTAEQIEFLANLAAYAVITIEDARLLEELRHQVDTLTHLRELSLRLSSAVDTETVAEAAVETARELLECQYAVLFRYDASADRLTVLASLESVEPAGPGPGVDVVRQTAYRAARIGALQVIEAASISQPDAGAGPLSIAAAPIKRGERVREVLCVIFSGIRRFQPRELAALTQLVIQAGGHLENTALHERIRDASGRMSAILDSIRDGIILVDHEGRLAEANPSAERLLGLALSEHRGEPFVEVLRRYADLAEDHPGYPPAAIESLADVLQHEPERITRHQFERKSAANQTLYIEEIGSPVIDKDNLISGRLLVLRDITEARKLADYRDEITNMVVHDLRGPLASIINAIRIARDSIPELANYPIAEKTLSLATASAEKLIRLVGSLLEIAKLEARQFELQITPTAVSALVEEAIETLLPSIEKAQVTVERVVPADLPPVQVDADSIRRVFINLLDNALRYTPSGSAIRIVVTPEPVRHRLLVQVADSGPGIPPEERERIFDKYRQAGDNRSGGRNSTGVGLGLTFCKLALEAHGQTIWVDTASPLPGACFAFTLPTVHPPT